VDIKCHYCGHRVAADPETQRHTAAGAHAICRECLEAGKLETDTLG
jgi:hypothetical protein